VSRQCFSGAISKRRGLFPLATNRKPVTEAVTALIICHPEPAKSLPERRGVRERESGEHTRLACWRRRPADADFQSPKCIAATPRAKFAEAGRLDQHPGRVRSPELAFRRDQPRRCLWRGRQRPHARARALPGSWRDAGSRPTINAALWLPESLGMTKTMRAALVSVPGLGFVSAALCSCSPRLCRGRWRVPGTSSGRHPRTRRR